VNAVSNLVRWDTPYENGQTRRSRAIGFGKPTIEVIVPPCGAYIWEWFWHIRNTINGHEQPLTYSEIYAWRDMSGNLVSYSDCAILMAMDAAFRSAAKEVAKENAALMKRGKN